MDKIILITPQEFVDNSRLWKGTPFQHQCAIKGVAADCIGLPKGSISDFGYDVSEVPCDYSRHSQPEILLDYLNKSTLVKRDPTNTLKMGRIALFIVYKEPHHFGIISDPGMWIHADVHFGVVETPIGKWAERVHSVWVPVMLKEDQDE